MEVGSSNQPQRSRPGKRAETPPDASEEVAAVAARIEAIRRSKGGGGHGVAAPGGGGAEPAGSPGGEERAQSEARLAELQRLSEQRGRREPAWTIKPLVSAIQVGAQRADRKLGELIALWEELLAPEVAEHTRVLRLRGGVLHVAAADSATAFELSTLLRSGLEAQLRQRFAGTLTSVRVKMGPVGE